MSSRSDEQTEREQQGTRLPQKFTRKWRQARQHRLIVDTDVFTSQKLRGEAKNLRKSRTNIFGCGLEVVSNIASVSSKYRAL